MLCKRADHSALMFGTDTIFCAFSIRSQPKRLCVLRVIVWRGRGRGRGSGAAVQGSRLQRIAKRVAT